MNAIKPAPCRRYLAASCACLGLFAGCMGEAGVPRDGSPVVSTESPAFRQAHDEAVAKIKSDQAAEAKARRGRKSAPE